MREENRNTILPDPAPAAISPSQLLHFRHPRDVLAAEHIDKDDKRAVLASWASDQFAVEAMPTLRHYPGTECAVSYDEILDALKALDDVRPARQASGAARRPLCSKVVSRIAAERFDYRKIWKGECRPKIA